MKRALRDCGLSLILLSCFAFFWALQAWFGYLSYEKELSEHGEGDPGFRAYLASGHFWQATAENWESEFLQMGAYVFLSSFLYQRGSAESKDPDKAEECDEEVEKHSQEPGAPRAIRHSGLNRWLFQYSLGLAFLFLFLISFILHAVSGHILAVGDARHHRQPPPSFWDYVTEAEFWFQSMQNWQSEFLAVLSIVVLSIWCRHHGSPESKCVWAPHSSTGKG